LEIAESRKGEEKDFTQRGTETKRSQRRGRRRNFQSGREAAGYFEAVWV
jgi:hypothetical protein